MGTKTSNSVKSKASASGIQRWTTRELVSLMHNNPGPCYAIFTLSTDGQRIQKDTDFTLPPSPVKQVRLTEVTQVVNNHFDDNDLDLNEALPFAGIYAVWDENSDVHVDGDVKAKRYVSSDEPLNAWIPFRDEYLEEMIGVKASDWVEGPCMHCPPGEIALPALFRCDDCFGMVPVCQECCIAEHAQLPLHIMQKWNGTFFEKISLQSLGLCIQLGHGGNSPCPA
ncbi:hypothetical protein C8J56DRAFT_1062778 [Mycena floridula]|nr:hypothetical protein C8J56DRAFT_1062778 [Mycena floridula]